MNQWDPEIKVHRKKNWYSSLKRKKTKISNFTEVKGRSSSSDTQMENGRWENSNCTIDTYRLIKINLLIPI